jgi:uncharacterized protein (DUF305 family)
VSELRRLHAIRAVAAPVACALLAGVLVAACGGGGGSGDDDVNVVQPGAPGEAGRELTDEEAARVEPPEHTSADTAFMQDMIVHHQQALEMAALVDDRTERDDLSLLAERITVSQEGEIERMEQWLIDRDEDPPDRDSDGSGGDGGDHPEHLMPGMATAAQLDQLEAARDTAFDQLFLELMIAHHQGALTMVADLYSAGGGLEPEADRFARDVEADQNIEIRRMQDLLAALPRQ